MKISKFLLVSSVLVSSFVGLSSFDSGVHATGLKFYQDLNEEQVKYYYSSLKNGMKSNELLDNLQKILVKGQGQCSYQPWSNYVLLDRDWEKSPLTKEEISRNKWNVDGVWTLPLYDEKPFYFDSGKSPGTYLNREHVFPKSYGLGNGDSTPKAFAATDMHNLHLGEARNNQEGHSNYPYGNVDKTKPYSKIVSTISGKVTGYTGSSSLTGETCYEPLDKDKGDIARSIFYMATCYHNYDETRENSPALKLSQRPVFLQSSTYASQTKSRPCQYGILGDLLEWNILDPVDDHEIHRNNLCYNAVQFNRNPYIDYPSWAEIAFGGASFGINLDEKPCLFGDTKEDPTPIDPTPVDPTEGENKVTEVNLKIIEGKENKFFVNEEHRITHYLEYSVNEGAEVKNVSWKSYDLETLIFKSTNFTAKKVGKVNVSVFVNGVESNLVEINVTEKSEVAEPTKPDEPEKKDKSVFYIIGAVVVATIVILSVVFGKKPKKRRKKK